MSATPVATLIKDVAAAWAQEPALRPQIERHIIEASPAPIRLGLGIKWMATLKPIRRRRVPSHLASIDELAGRIEARNEREAAAA